MRQYKLLTYMPFAVRVGDNATASDEHATDEKDTTEFCSIYRKVRYSNHKASSHMQHLVMASLMARGRKSLCQYAWVMGGPGQTNGVPTPEKALSREGGGA